jgi:hypothetical protein
LAAQAAFSVMRIHDLMAHLVPFRIEVLTLNCRLHDDVRLDRKDGLIYDGQAD